MPSDWIVILLVSSVSAQYYGNYYGRYGCSRFTTGRVPPPIGWTPPITVDPYNAANTYAMRGMVVDPAVSGMCVDTNMQCPVWASTGQCATNALMMRRMCALSCGTCGLGMQYGMGMGMGVSGMGYALPPGLGSAGFGTAGLGSAGLGAAGLGYGGMGLSPFANPLLGRSIYEQGILRAPPRSTIYPRSVKKDKLDSSRTSA